MLLLESTIRKLTQAILKRIRLQSLQTVTVKNLGDIYETFTI